MQSYWKSVRGQNLLIAAGVYLVAAYFCMHAQQAPNVMVHTWQLICVLFAMIYGNTDNDICDQKIDIHKAKGSERQGVPLSSMLQIRNVSLLSGFLAALFCAFLLQDQAMWWYTLLVYSIVVLLLWLYNRYLSAWPLIGNLVVAFLSALVPVLAMGASYWLFGFPEQRSFPMQCLIGFAFFGTLWREWVKDLEDVVPDKLGGRNTLPIFLGPLAVKILSTLLALLLMYGYAVAFFIMLWIESFVLMPGIIVLGLMTIYIQWLVWREKYTSAALLIKFWMLVGIIWSIFLVVVWKN